MPNNCLQIILNIKKNENNNLLAGWLAGLLVEADS